MFCEEVLVHLTVYAYNKPKFSSDLLEESKGELKENLTEFSM